MMSIADVFLVEMVGVDLFLAVRCSQKLDKIGEELVRILLNNVSRIISKRLDIAHVGLGHNMTLETVLVATCLLASLTVPAQASKSLLLHLIRDVLGGPNFGARHDGGGRV